MTKYKFDKNGNVDNLETGQRGISPRVWLWRGYQEWLDEGNITEPYQTPEEVAEEEAQNQKIASLEIRIQEIESEKVVSGLKEISIVEARQWVKNQFAGAETQEEINAVNEKIWLKVLPYILS